MPTILVVDDKKSFRVLVQAALSANGYQVAAASNGWEALTALSTHVPHLILLDLRMPVMDGLTVLARIRSNDRTRGVPVLVLTGTGDRPCIIKAARLGISGYLLKSRFSAQNMLKRIRDALAHVETSPPHRRDNAAAPPADSALATPMSLADSPRAPGPSTFDPQSVRPLVTRSELAGLNLADAGFSGFSPTVSHLLKITADSNGSIAQIAAAVGQDPVIAVKILKLANSPLYSRDGRAETVRQAVGRIGMQGIRDAVISIGVVERFSGGALASHLNMPLFWEHSIACGIISAEIARAIAPDKADTAFTCGLLHDLGRLILAEVLGDKYITVLQTASQTGAPLDTIESRLLLSNHAAIMEQVLGAWKFSRQLIDPIVHHHDAPLDIHRLCPKASQDVLRLSLANCLAHAMLLGDSGDQVVYPTEDHCRLLNVGENIIRKIRESSQVQTRDARLALLSHADAGPWPDRAKQIRHSLKQEFRPLVVSAAPEVDAYSILCAQLADGGPGMSPNIAVVHIAAARDRAALAERLAAAEHQTRSDKLPVLMLAPAGHLGLPDSVLAGRRYRMIATPFRIAEFVSATNELMTSEGKQAA